MSPVPIDLCPECVAGKHSNCDGVANLVWNPDTREEVYIRCECNHLTLGIPEAVLTSSPSVKVDKVPDNDPGILTEAFPELVEDGAEVAFVRMKPDATIIKDMYDVEVQNAWGAWVPAVPLPLTWPLGIKQCYCGKFRLGHKRYQEHYAYAHILGMDAS